MESQVLENNFPAIKRDRPFRANGRPRSIVQKQETGKPLRTGLPLTALVPPEQLPEEWLSLRDVQHNRL